MRATLWDRAVNGAALVLWTAFTATAQPATTEGVVQDATPSTAPDPRAADNATPATPASLPSLPDPASPPTPASDRGAASAQRLVTFITDAEAWLLAGEALPPELPKLLEPMLPADRLVAVAYLRRLGLLQGTALDLQRLLAPMPTHTPTPEGGA